MTTTYLLDASVLIPLVAVEHLHHERVINWAARTSNLAICPVVEGAFVRFSVRLGAKVSEARHALQLMRSRPGFEFWPDSISYVDADLSHVRGHSQVTDAYLAALAVANIGILATLDEGLSQQRPETTLLVPA